MCFDFLPFCTLFLCWKTIQPIMAPKATDPIDDYHEHLLLQLHSWKGRGGRNMGKSCGFFRFWAKCPRLLKGEYQEKSGVFSLRECLWEVSSKTSLRSIQNIHVYILGGGFKDFYFQPYLGKFSTGLKAPTSIDSLILSCASQKKPGASCWVFSPISLGGCVVFLGEGKKVK